MNEIIHTALCSFGMSGQVFHAPFLSAHPSFNLYGVLERTKNNSKVLYPDIKIFRSLDEILNDDFIELVVVNTPSVTHFDLAKKVIESGKNVIIEKPMTATILQSEELIKLAKDRNLLLSVYHNRRFDSDFKTLQKVVNQNLVGNLIEAELYFERFNPNLSPKVHKETPTQAVGNLYDLGSHLIDQAVTLFGMPDAVFADIDKFREDSKVDDYFDLKLYYPNFKVRLKSSYFVREKFAGNILHGTKGTFIKSKADVQEKQLQDGINPNSMAYGLEPENEEGLLHTELNGEIVRKRYPTEKGNYMEFYNSIYSALRENGEVAISGEDGLNVVKIIEAAFKSGKERKVVEI